MTSSKTAKRKRRARRRAIIEGVARRDRASEVYEHWHTLALLMEDQQLVDELNGTTSRRAQVPRRKRLAIMDEVERRIR